MLYFVIPLRSARTANDWPTVQKLLQNTLNSAHNQTNAAFRILLIGHEQPDAVSLPASCEWIEAPFPPPAIQPGNRKSERDLTEMRSDKGQKLLCGLDIARRDPLGFVMFLDADDLVSNRLAEWVANHPNENGWYIDSGYRMDLSTPGFLFRRRKFFEECGSSHILKASLALFPDKNYSASGFDHYFVRRYVLHANLRDSMRRIGYPLRPLPFPGAIYTFNGENLYATTFRGKDSGLRRFGRFLLKGKLITGATRAEFGIP